jgi:hypothetical protein
VPCHQLQVARPGGQLGPQCLPLLLFNHPGDRTGAI